MRMIVLILALLVTLSGCNCKPPAIISVVREGDKDLSCKDIKNEMYQSEYYRDAGQKDRGIGMDKALTPLCWYGAYSNSTAAVEAANHRLERLQQLYDSKQCATKKDDDEKPKANGDTPQPLQRTAIPPQAIPAQQMQPQMQQPMQQIQPQQMQTNDPNLHIHVLPDGTRYMHSHPNPGPHTHAPDGSIMLLK